MIKEWEKGNRCYQSIFGSCECDLFKVGLQIKEKYMPHGIPPQLFEIKKNLKIVNTGDWVKLLALYVKSPVYKKYYVSANHLEDELFEI
jgi:hypothetical protein